MPRGCGGQGKVQGLKPVLVVYVSTHRKCFRHTTTLGSAIIKSRFLLSNGYFKFLRDSLISSSLQHELPPHDAKNRLTGRDPDAGKDWRQEEKGMIEGEMVEWHRWLDGNEFGQELVMDREAWRAAVHGAAESDATELSWLNSVNRCCDCSHFQVTVARLRGELASDCPKRHSGQLSDDLMLFPLPHHAIHCWRFKFCKHTLGINISHSSFNLYFSGFKSCLIFE